VKAPQFEGILGFEKDENGLFEVHACTDRAGFVHINLDAAGECEAPGVEELLRFAGEEGVTAGSKWVSEWDISGECNWKMIGRVEIRMSDKLG
jgi:hypothetical protein